MVEDGVVIVNFAHPLTAAQLAEIEAQTRQQVAQVYHVPADVDLAQKLEIQVKALVDTVPLSPEAWQTLPLLINPPGLAPLTAVLIAELHGRLGHFPTLLWIRPVTGAVPPRYEVAGLLDLRSIRDHARPWRFVDEGG